MRGPINEELHKYREEHARRLNDDLAAICKNLTALSRKLETVRLPPKKTDSKEENYGAFIASHPSKPKSESEVA